MNRLVNYYAASNPAHKKIKNIYKGLRECNTDQIIDFGLHEFLTKFIDDISIVYGDLERVYFLGTDK